jgi:hypothetical protein
MPNDNIIHIREFQRKSPRQAVFRPVDFYTFRHRTFPSGPAGTTRWMAPHWVVGHSPFDELLTAEEGHLVHVGRPQFVARWSYQEERIAEGIKTQHWLDEELGLLIHEVSWLDAPPADWATWLLEACCAVAYAKGDLAENMMTTGGTA